MRSLYGNASSLICMNLKPEGAGIYLHVTTEKMLESNFVCKSGKKDVPVDRRKYLNTKHPVNILLEKKNLNIHGVGLLQRSFEKGTDVCLPWNYFFT